MLGLFYLEVKGVFEIKTTVTFHMEVDDLTRLNALSREVGESKASIIREAIKREIARRVRHPKREVDLAGQKV